MTPDIDGEPVHFGLAGDHYEANGQALECTPAKTGPIKGTVSDTQDCSYGAPSYDNSFPLSPIVCLGIAERSDYPGAQPKDYAAIRAHCAARGGSVAENYDIDGRTEGNQGERVPLPEIPGVFEQTWGR
jgi:hypothetical protein